MSLNCLSGQGVGGESVNIGWICRLDSRVNRQWLACISTEVVSKIFLVCNRQYPTYISPWSLVTARKVRLHNCLISDSVALVPGAGGSVPNSVNTNPPS